MRFGQGGREVTDHMERERQARPLRLAACVVQDGLEVYTSNKLRDHVGEFGLAPAREHLRGRWMLKPAHLLEALAKRAFDAGLAARSSRLRPRCELDRGLVSTDVSLRKPDLASPPGGEAAHEGVACDLVPGLRHRAQSSRLLRGSVLTRNFRLDSIAKPLEDRTWVSVPPTPR